MVTQDKIIIRSIEDEMKNAYIDYSMSVIVSRALPDIRDGLKPVHRRVLYGMSDLGLASNRPYKKSARIVGEVLGKYHPHGDSSVYDTLVRMAQFWSLRYPLVDGQGNFGSMDGDSPAAMRYTEARLRATAESMLEDIDKDTINFVPNFDDSLTEPSVLPSRIPNLLVNGSDGIAVGMATKMAPHNLREVCAGIIAYIDNRDITIKELTNFILAPDFPTGGIIYGYDGVMAAFETGRGKITLRALAKIESLKNGKERIVFTEIPYQVNKAMVVEKIAELVTEKKIEGIQDIRDESDREGVRVVVELKKDAVATVVLNNLYKFTQLQITFSVNNICLVKGRPQQVNLKDLIHHYVEHRHEIVVRRTQYELKQAQARAHILEGLLIALDHLDEVIALIRRSQTTEEARDGLIATFELSEIQAKAILDMRLQSLTALNRDKIRQEYEELLKKIEYYQKVLSDEKLRMSIIKEEIKEISKKYGDDRRTQIIYNAEDFSVEDFIAEEDVAITVSHAGYIKRTALSGYRRQGRGGVGLKGAETREEDFVEYLFIASTHDYMLFFTEAGRCYWKKVFEIPESARASKGRAIQNIIQIPPNDNVRAFINVRNLEDEHAQENRYIIMCTRNGTIKKTALKDYSRPRPGGIIAINIVEGDRLLAAAICDDQSEIVIAKKSGLVNRFHATDVRSMGRDATGVRGIELEDDQDEVIGMVVVRHPQAQLLVVSENGFGKRSSIEEYRLTKRGSKGVKAMNVTEKAGNLVAILEVNDTDDIMIITTGGIAIRMPVSSISLLGRNTQGNRLIKLKEDDAIAAVAKMAEKDEEDHSSSNGNSLPTAVADE
jgi:DNA gyrase subunit A